MHIHTALKLPVQWGWVVFYIEVCPKWGHQGSNWGMWLLWNRTQNVDYNHCSVKPWLSNLDTLLLHQFVEWSWRCLRRVHVCTSLFRSVVKPIEPCEWALPVSSGQGLKCVNLGFHSYHTINVFYFILQVQKSLEMTDESTATESNTKRR